MNFIVGPSVLKISLGTNLMTTNIMLRFSYVSALILFLLGIVNIIFAWKTHSYLYTADIKRKTVTKSREHAALSLMALDRSPSPLMTPPTPSKSEQIVHEQKKPIQIYLLIKE
jgi:Ca2+/H+ antiporter